LVGIDEQRACICKQYTFNALLKNGSQTSLHVLQGAQPEATQERALCTQAAFLNGEADIRALPSG
jgi:hypothetical protein